MNINLPNILTLFRILATPLFVIYLLKHMYGSGLVVFVLAGVSDGLDGLLARYMNQRTKLGAYLDPIADKLLLTASYVTLAALELIPAWAAVIVISRDVVISIGIAILALNNIDWEIKPSYASKFTTATQLLTVFFALLDALYGSLSIGVLYLCWATALITIISGLHYVYLGMNILQEGMAANGSHRKSSGNKP